MKIIRILRRMFPKRILQWKRVLTQSPHIEIIHHGNFVFLCPNGVMSQIARDLTCCINADDFQYARKPILIYVGIHCHFGRHWFKWGYKIGIQTEQIYDERRKELWGGNFFDLHVNIDQAFMFLDGNLDLNIGNSEFYRKNMNPAQRPKQIFGPFIFPKNKVSFSRGGDSSLPTVAFYGSVGTKGTRRRDILDGLSHLNIISPDGPCFGGDLDHLIKKCNAVLNIHWEEGAYAEAPRLLSAYLHGKAVISEPLGQFFDEGKHFCSLSDDDLRNFRSAFENFSELVTTRYSFYDALVKLGVHAP
jgi:hypothetical protein